MRWPKAASSRMQRAVRSSTSYARQCLVCDPPGASSSASANGNSSTISPSSSVTSMIAFKQRAVGAFVFEQFEDHGARHFPGAVGIAQLFAFGIGDQLIADPGVEKISRHRLEPDSIAASKPEVAGYLTGYLSAPAGHVDT